MAAPRFDFYEVVTIGQSSEAVELELAGAEGVVLGVSVHEETGEISYAIQIDGLGSVIFGEQQLTATGRSVTAESIYDGSELHVSRDGRIDGVEKPSTEEPEAHEE